MIDRKLLGIYLNDHLSVLTAGVEVANRSVGSNRGEPLANFLDEVGRRLAEERQALVDLMDELEIRRDRAKQVAGWTFEKFGRLKPNGRVFSYSPLSRVTELEGLATVTQMTAALWGSLAATFGEERRRDLAERAAAAEELLGRIDESREAAARRAFLGA